VRARQAVPRPEYGPADDDRHPDPLAAAHDAAHQATDDTSGHGDGHARRVHHRLTARTERASAMAELEDPITQLASAAAQLHELYLSYLAAGFTEAQAFDLVKTILTAGVGGQS
jgi:hypothetical protein